MVKPIFVNSRVNKILNLIHTYEKILLIKNFRVTASREITEKT